MLICNRKRNDKRLHTFGMKNLTSILVRFIMQTYQKNVNGGGYG